MALLLLGTLLQEPPCRCGFPKGAGGPYSCIVQRTDKGTKVTKGGTIGRDLRGLFGGYLGGT